MSELSGFWTTTGTAAGDQQASYTQAHWSSALKITAACNGFEGVAADYLNELACTATGANTVAVNTGGAMVDGKWYYNDASQNVNIPSASGEGNTRIDRVVLRADWANFNVSVYRIAGTDAATPTAPAVTQTTGTTYDILLYQALVDTDGTVTLTDERVFADLGDDSVNSQHYVDGSIDTAHIADSQITVDKMAANSVDSDQYVDGSIDTAHLADNAVDYTKVGNRVAQIVKRQGGDASDWSVAGTTSYDPTGVLIQVGVATTLGGGGWLTVTYPQEFSQPPILFVRPANGLVTNDPFAALYDDGTGDYTAALFKVNLYTGAGTAFAGDVFWMAIGPE